MTDFSLYPPKWKNIYYLDYIDDSADRATRMLLSRDRSKYFVKCIGNEIKSIEVHLKQYKKGKNHCGISESTTEEEYEG